MLRMNTPNHFDVVIVGAGMVGATLAAALADSNLRIAVLEGAVPQDVRVDDPVDLRVSAVTCVLQQVFTAIGAWPGMVARRVSPFCVLFVWVVGCVGVFFFVCVVVGEDAFCFFVVF